MTGGWSTPPFPLNTVFRGLLEPLAPLSFSYQGTHKATDMTDGLATRYRERALDMRRLAERAHHEYLRYLDMAADWDRMADDTERVEMIQTLPCAPVVSNATSPTA